MTDRQVWDSPGGLLEFMPLCACGHPYVVHDLNPKGQRTRCTLGPISEMVVQCPCKRYKQEGKP